VVPKSEKLTTSDRKTNEFDERRKRLPVKLEEKRVGNQIVSTLKDEPSQRIAAMETFGTTDGDLTVKLLSQIVRASPTSGIAEENATLAALHGIHPRDELEGLLAAQMIAVHNMGMECMARAVLSNQTVEGVDTNVNRASKLFRTFAQQTEALNRYRVRGQQQVVVQHVQVNGGQAVVGTINARRGDDEKDR
jgi:hypothetical protein